MIRRVENDPDNRGAWRIVNAATGKPVVINLPEKEAREFAGRMEAAHKKRMKEAK